MPLYKDISSVQFNSTGIAEVVSAEINEGGQSIDHSSDTDAYLTYIDMVKKFVSVTINTDDLQDALDTFTVGQSSTLTFTLHKAQGTPNLSVSISNCVLESMSASPRHADVNSGGSLRFRAYSSDGTTSPMGIS